jgi:hypothetical protein
MTIFSLDLLKHLSRAYLKVQAEYKHIEEDNNLLPSDHNEELRMREDVVGYFLK